MNAPAFKKTIFHCPSEIFHLAGPSSMTNEKFQMDNGKWF
jgi:hypothetical protein